MKKMTDQITRKQILCILAAVLVLLAVLAGIRRFSPQEDPSADQSEQGLTMSFVKAAAKNAIKELKLVLADIQENDLDSARERISDLYRTVDSVRAPVERSISLFGSNAQLRKKLEKVMVLLDTADMALTEIAVPAIDLLEAYPISGLKVGDGFDTKLVGHYLDFAESVMPQIGQVLDCANSIDLQELDGDGEISGYLELANQIVEIYRNDPSVISMLKAMLGVDEDRLYVVAVQNPVEIRASGGFPGSVGTMRIQDGVLTVGDFQSVTYMLSSSKPKDIQITNEEWELFNYLSGIQTPKDADLCPDFERVGHIWASAYEEMHREPVAGVLAVTPHIVQRILNATGQTIELFDGLVMNGENAMEVLLHDIYFKYFSQDYVADREKISDDLFADAAAKTMGILTDNVSISQFLKYIPVLKESVEDRTLMLWMKDETEQAFVTKAGLDGGLNSDPRNPAAGVYFNCILPSKMGWYFLMDTQIGERTGNEDGSYTYPVTVVFNNNATEDEMQIAATYITGGMSGSIRGTAYFFAPAGGSVSEFTVSSGQKIQMKTYHGLELGFMDAFVLKPNTPITITYRVTTAPGVEKHLEISKTPTAQLGDG